MTGQEYIQLKAFARVDGLVVAAVMVAAFGSYVLGLQAPGWNLAAMGLTVSVPFVVGWRVKRYRDHVLDGRISFMRALGYVVLAVFYAALLFALAQYVYFAYMDGGYVSEKLTEMMARPENSEMLRQLGMNQQVDQSLELLRQMRPIDLSLEALTSLLLISPLMGLPLAAILQRGKGNN